MVKLDWRGVQPNALGRFAADVLALPADLPEPREGRISMRSCSFIGLEDATEVLTLLFEEAGYSVQTASGSFRVRPVADPSPVHATLGRMNPERHTPGIPTLDEVDVVLLPSRKRVVAIGDNADEVQMAYERLEAEGIVAPCNESLFPTSSHD